MLESKDHKKVLIPVALWIWRLAAVARAVGLGIAAAARANSRAYYDGGYGYYGPSGPAYVVPAPGPYYYGGYGRYGSSVPLDQSGHPNASW